MSMLSPPRASKLLPIRTGSGRGGVGGGGGSDADGAAGDDREAVVPERAAGNGECSTRVAGCGTGVRPRENVGVDVGEGNGIRAVTPSLTSPAPTPAAPASAREPSGRSGLAPVRARRATAANSAAERHRCCGSTANARVTTAATGAGISGGSGGQGSRSRLVATSNGLSPSNGFRPVRHSYATTPRAYTSDR